MKALALDFDGVISDSAREAYVVAFRTWAELHPESRLAPLAADAHPEAPEHAELYARFLDLMPLGNRAEDYGVSLLCLERERPVADQAAYDAVYAEQDPAELARFHEHFYATRHRWMERDPAGWRALLAPYPGVLELLRKRAPEVELAVATSKDRHSVTALLDEYGIRDLLPAERVLDKEVGKNKRAHLEHLERMLGVPFPEITFVDDKVNHLESVAPLGVRCALAAWGYNGARERSLARRQGFLVCTLEDVEAALFGP